MVQLEGYMAVVNGFYSNVICRRIIPIGRSKFLHPSRRFTLRSSGAAFCSGSNCIETNKGLWCTASKSDCWGWNWTFGRTSRHWWGHFFIAPIALNEMESRRTNSLHQLCFYSCQRAGRCSRVFYESIHCVQLERNACALGSSFSGILGWHLIQHFAFRQTVDPLYNGRFGIRCWGALTDRQRLIPLFPPWYSIPSGFHGNLHRLPMLLL